jgi:hypothetical protein
MAPGKRRTSRTAVRTDEAAVLESAQGDEQADADGDAVFEPVGHGRDHLAPNAGQGQDDEDEAGQEIGPQGDLPGVAHGPADDDGEEDVVAHGRGLGDGVIGQQAREERRQGRGQASGHHDRALVHARRPQHGRLDEDDVGHGHEGRRAAEELAADGGAVLGEMEGPFKEAFHARSLPGLARFPGRTGIRPQ